MNLAFQILACSGPGALRVIAESIRIGYYNAAFVGLAAAAGVLLHLIHWRRGGWAFAIAYLLFGTLLLLWHPAWTVSAYHGDCGDAKRFYSYIVSAVAAAPFIIEFYAARKRTKIA